MVMEMLRCVLHISLLLYTQRKVSGIPGPGWTESSFRLKGNASKHTVTFAKSLYPLTNIILQVKCKKDNDNGMMATFYMEGLLSYQHCLSSNYVKHIPDSTWTRMELKCQSLSIPLAFVRKLLGNVHHAYHQNYIGAEHSSTNQSFSDGHQNERHI